MQSLNYFFTTVTLMQHLHKFKPYTGIVTLSINVEQGFVVYSLRKAPIYQVFHNNKTSSIALLTRFTSKLKNRE